MLFRPALVVAGKHLPQLRSSSSLNMCPINSRQQYVPKSVSTLAAVHAMTHGCEGPG